MMTDLAITSPAASPSPARTAVSPPEKPAPKPARKTDVIDISKQPTPERHLRQLHPAKAKCRRL